MKGNQLHWIEMNLVLVEICCIYLSKPQDDIFHNFISFCYTDTIGSLLPPLPPEENNKRVPQDGDDKYDDEDGDAKLTYFNFTAFLNPDDPLFEDEQQVCSTTARWTSPCKQSISCSLQEYQTNLTFQIGL